MHILTDTYLQKHSIIIEVRNPPTGQYSVLVVRRHPCQDYHNKEDAEPYMGNYGGGSGIRCETDAYIYGKM